MELKEFTEKWVKMTKAERLKLVQDNVGLAVGDGFIAGTDGSSIIAGYHDYRGWGFADDTWGYYFSGEYESYSFQTIEALKSILKKQQENEDKIQA